MPWIAKTNGATTGQVAELREGVLTDIPVADRGNWRAVNENAPNHDTNTHAAAITSLPIAANGTVSATWTTVALPVALGKLNLEHLARAVMQEKEAAGLITIGTKQVAIHDGFLWKLQVAQMQIDRGAPNVSVQTADGDIVEVNAATLASAITTILTARFNIAEARETIVAAIRAGTVTTSVGVRQHASWPV